MNSNISFLDDQKFSDLALQVSKSPKTLAHWEALLNHFLSISSPISKSIDEYLLELIRSTYESMLFQFPFLENYHIEYALLEYKLGNITRMHKIFENGLQCFNNRSLLLWIEYLKICNRLISDDRLLFKKYEFAESYIGLHFFSGEFWHLYLDEIKLRCKMPQHYIKVLRKIIEIPLYEYCAFYDLWLQAIEDVTDLSELRYFASDDELWKKLKINSQLQGRRGPHLQYSKKSLRNITKEMYLTVQYEVMEIFELFESKISTRFYTSPETLAPHQDVVIWFKYLDYTTKKKNGDLIKLQFQRALLPLAHYEDIWLQYSKFLVDDLNDYLGAKNILMQALTIVHKKSKVIKMLSSVMTRLGQFSELSELYDELENVFSHDIARTDDFELFIDFINFKLFLSSTISKSRYSGTSDNFEFSKSIFDKLVNRIEQEKNQDHQTLLLNLVNQMYERFPRHLVEKNIYQFIIENKWDSYLENGSFWYLYCSMVWFDSSQSYLLRRRYIMKKIVPLTIDKSKEVKIQVENFLNNYLADDLELFNSINDTR